MVKTETLSVSGMKCGGCENNIETKLSSIAGVLKAKANRITNSVEVEFDPDKTGLTEIIAAIGEAGYTVE